MGRRKRIEDEELLAVAREVFSEKGIGASTREIARRAGISEAVIYQRHPTKADLFFAAMVPPALELEALFAHGGEGVEGCERLETIALGMLQYFRDIMPILLPLVTHPSFDFERFARQHPESPLAQLREGLVTHLAGQSELAHSPPDQIGAAALTLVASMHGFAFFERMGVHGGRFEDEMVRNTVRLVWHGLRDPAQALP